MFKPSNQRHTFQLAPIALLVGALSACSDGNDTLSAIDTETTDEAAGIFDVVDSDEAAEIPEIVEVIDTSDETAEIPEVVEVTDTIESADVTEVIVAGTSSSSAGVLCDLMDITFNASESVNASSESSWECSDTQRLLTANGLPDHDVGTFPNPANPNTIAALEVSAAFTLTPELADRSTNLGGPLGPQGYVLNGVKIDAGTGGSCEDFGEACSGGNNSGNWNLEALGHTSFDFGADENNAHVQPDGTYHYHGMPEGFIEKLGGNSSTMTLIAWASDGFPIYARYGYSIADDAGSAIEVMTGSYQLVSDIAETRPPVDVYEMGTFEQDWEFVAGSGHLDQCNGRFGVTPEFPGGIYHYYATDSYPYFQRCVNGVIESAGGPGGEGPGGAPGNGPR